MTEKKPDQAHELALIVLKNGTISEAHKAELAELLDGYVRYELGEALEGDGIKPADTAELVKKLELEMQYGERLNTLKYYGFLTENGEANKGDVQKPSFEKAMRTFKPKELEIASHFQKPTLLLIPETSFKAKVEALNAHKQGIHENDTYIDKIYTDSDSCPNEITGWRAVIVDGAQDMESYMEAYKGDQLDLGVDKRVKNRKSARKSGEKGMDRHRYALLMMETIRNGHPIDKELYTLLDDDSALSDSGVPRADFGPDRRGVNFSKSYPGNVDGRARFRSSVGGDVLIS